MFRSPTEFIQQVRDGVSTAFEFALDGYIELMAQFTGMAAEFTVLLLFVALVHAIALLGLIEAASATFRVLEKLGVISSPDQSSGEARDDDADEASKRIAGWLR